MNLRNICVHVQASPQKCFEHWIDYEDTNSSEVRKTVVNDQNLYPLINLIALIGR